MSVGLMCDCPLPPMAGLTFADKGHGPRPGDKRDCPNYAEDQKRGGRCRFCADAERIGHLAAALAATPAEGPYEHGIDDAEVNYDD